MKIQKAALLADSIGSHVAKLQVRCSQGLKVAGRPTSRKLSSEAPAPRGTPYSKLTIGVPKEIFPNEKRVALSPAATQLLVKKGFKVQIEAGAGESAKFLNEDYESAGAVIMVRFLYHLFITNIPSLIQI